MEERNPLDKNNDKIKAQELALTISPSPSRNIHQPFVVQYPREQIFRVPPPQNAQFVVERQQNTENKKGSSGCCFGCCGTKLCISLFLLLILICVAVALVVTFFEASPASPTFTVHKFSIDEHESSKKHRSPPPPTFNITVVAHPRTKNGIVTHYPATGRSTLYHKKKKIAAGKFRWHELRDTDDHVSLKQFLSAAHGHLPKDMEHSLEVDSSKDDKSEMTPITMDLHMTGTIEIVRYGIQKKNVNLLVKCSFTVNRLGKGSKITKQSCKSSIRGWT